MKCSLLMPNSVRFSEWQSGRQEDINRLREREGAWMRVKSPFATLTNVARRRGKSKIELGNDGVNKGGHV